MRPAAAPTSAAWRSMRPRIWNPRGAATAADCFRRSCVIRRIGRAEMLPETLDVMVDELGTPDGAG